MSSSNFGPNRILRKCWYELNYAAGCHKARKDNEEFINGTHCKFCHKNDVSFYEFAAEAVNPKPPIRAPEAKIAPDSTIKRFMGEIIISLNFAIAKNDWKEVNDCKIQLELLYKVMN